MEEENLNELSAFNLPAKRFTVDINKDPIKPRNTIELEYDISYTVEGIKKHLTT